MRGASNRVRTGPKIQSQSSLSSNTEVSTGSPSIHPSTQRRDPQALRGNDPIFILGFLSPPPTRSPHLHLHPHLPFSFCAHPLESSMHHHISILKNTVFL